MNVSRRHRYTRALAQTYDVIKTFIETNGYPPSCREVGVMLDISSMSTVWERLQRLKSLGLITFTERKSRTMRIVGCPISRSDVA